MEEMNRGMARLSIRSANKKIQNDKKRIGSDRSDDLKKPGFFNSFKKLFANENRVDELPCCVDQPACLPSAKLFFIPEPGVDLPQGDDCGDFPEDICHYMYYREGLTASSLLHGSIFSNSQRTKIVVYIAERHAECPNALEVFHLAVWMFDQLIKHQAVTRDTAELNCIVALHLASKYERQTNYSRLLKECNVAERKKAEIKLYSVLSYDLGVHTVIHYLRILSAGAFLCLTGDLNDLIEWRVAKALSQLAVSDSVLVAGVRPSLLAAAIIRLSLELVHKPWTDRIQRHCQHSREDVERITMSLKRLLLKTLTGRGKATEILWNMKNNRTAVVYLESKIEFLMNVEPDQISLPISEM